MNSVQTKEVSSALGALAKAKANRGSAFTATVQQPVAVFTEQSNTEVPATLEQAPEEEIVSATPVSTPEPQGRYSEQVYHDFRVHHDRTVSDLREQLRQKEEALAQAAAPKIELPRTKEELAEFKKSNPDSFDIIKAIAMETAEELGSDVKKQLEAVKKSQMELREQEAFGKLLEKHPDAKEIKASPEFAKWFNEQPEDIRNTLANSKDVNSVIKLLTLYKIETGNGVNPKAEKKAATQQRVDASLAVPIKSVTEVQPQKKIWARSEINAICANYSLWNKHKDEIDTARREGRVDETK